MSETIQVEHVVEGTAQLIVEEEQVHIPSNCFVVHRETKQVIDATVISKSLASEVVLVPKVAGG